MKSFISFDTYQKLESRPALVANRQKCFGINGQPLPVEGALQATVSFSRGTDVSYSGTFLVSRHLCKPLQCILGWDFLTTNCLSLTYNCNGAYCLTGESGDIPLIPQEEFSAYPSLSHPENSPEHSQNQVLFNQSQHKGPVPITLTESISIPGRTEMLVTGKVPKSYAEEFGMVSPVNKDSIPTNVLVAYSVCQAENRDIPVRIMNSSNIVLQLESGQKICEFCPLVASVPSHSSQNNHIFNPSLLCGSLISNKVKDDLSSALSPSLDEHGRTSIMNTLLKFSDVFDESLGQTQVISHRIDTSNAAPIRQPPGVYHMPVEKKPNPRSVKCLNKVLFSLVLPPGPRPLS